jgi:hypothetical protein
VLRDRPAERGAEQVEALEPERVREASASAAMSATS